MSTALAGPGALPRVHVEHCMGTVFSFRVAAPGVDAATLREACAWLHRMDALFSTYRPDSEISRLVAGTLREADASPEVRHVLAECDRQRELTGGWFDAHPAGRDLDPSGYVKGWATRHAADLLTLAGSVNHCVNGGGDVVCAGRPAPGRPWRVGVADPSRPGTVLTALEGVGPFAVATSGTAERGAHIWDPHTGSPSTGCVSVTVVATDLVTADVHATAAVALGPEHAAGWLADRDLRAVVVRADGEVIHVGAP